MAAIAKAHSCPKCGKSQPTAITAGQILGPLPPRVITAAGPSRHAEAVDMLLRQRVRVAEELSREKNRNMHKLRDLAKRKGAALIAAGRENTALKRQLADARRERSELYSSVLAADVRATGDHLDALDRIRRATGQKPEDALAAGGGLVGQNLRELECRSRAQREAFGYLLGLLENGEKS